ncbi:NADH-quinone oxidoreductase subunit C [Caminibacter pacificus]|uniref:NADH-quinone oxidoreductase subunit C n=1 Tax=Caminibacter pacificus TaxID=1424653 RepID=A0AAJ4RDW2_9BACT|nr:NADH-quinone oxidoreductase subunit C [Caminibacter pacificus]NPA87969.1 NADH-quinone oxidoreductase subunit C [Campylobacterota bacterium]QCI28538.1 NADH-quinone oxidoreductase subunit C [Caminibacter pacificus]ROR40735.1 Ni,Fe-hydrogenase III component G [Caminibacter pacificus]
MVETLKRKVKSEIKERIEKFDLKEEKDEKGNIQLWLKIDKKDIVHMAQIIKDFGGRCVIISAYTNDEVPVLVYHFDIDGMLVNVEIKLPDNKVESITPILQSANWAEREFKEMYGIELIGHPNPKRLFLDESIAEGILKEYMPLSQAMNGAATCCMWERVEAQRHNDEY